nr:olfactory receptor 1N2-like [Pongo pygmaeus]
MGAIEPFALSRSCCVNSRRELREPAKQTRPGNRQQGHPGVPEEDAVRRVLLPGRRRALPGRWRRRRKGGVVAGGCCLWVGRGRLPRWGPGRDGCSGGRGRERALGGPGKEVPAGAAEFLHLEPALRAAGRRELSGDPELQLVLTGLFLFTCLVTVLGNLLIILAISADSHLHTPMYFFLSNLSLPDIGFTSTTAPKMIVDIQSHSRVISSAGLPDSDVSLPFLEARKRDMLLSVMAYDRFVAICHPLYRSVIMSPCFCGFLVLLSFFFFSVF